MDKKLLSKLCNLQSVSGKEDKIIEFITAYMKNLCDCIYVDNLGNVICTKYGNFKDKTITLDAHIDEVGFVVNKIHENGFVSFSPIGGIDDRILPSQEVVIQGIKEIPGVITSKPPHLTTKGENEVDHKSLFIDTGMSSQELCDLIRVGDLISYKPNFDLINKYVTGTSLDDRAGVCLIIEIFEKFKNIQLEYNLQAVFSVREEIGLRGASFADVPSSLAIVIDVTHGKTPDENRDVAFECGKGAALGKGPNVDNYYLDILTKISDEEDIPYQLEILEGNSGTNAWVYQVSNSGIPCLLLSFPLKYMHTPVECISIYDYDNMLSHLTAFLKSMKQNMIKDTSLMDIGDYIE